MIPDEAVEAALSALFPDRASVSGFTRAVQEPTIRTILEAAAPHLMRAAWDSGMQAMYESTSHEWPPIPERNPYTKCDAQ